MKTLSSQGSRFIASIVLARLLVPEDFGIMGIVWIVIHFAERLGNFGFAQVLVQKNIIDEQHVKTTFTLNFLLSALLTGVIFLFAPVIAQGVIGAKDAQLLPKVINVLRVISFIFVLNSLWAVPNSLLRREMKFKQESVISAVAGMIQFMSPIVFALFGFGVWSMVFGQLLGAFVHVVFFYLYTKVKPKFGLFKNVFKDIFSFGVWMNLYSYVNYAVKNVDYFMVSKFLGLAQLGYYERAFNLMNAPRKRLGDMVNAILFSTYSRIQDDEQRLMSALKKVMSFTAIAVFPVMTWLFFVSPSLIRLLYGEKWDLTIAPTQIMCLSGLIESITMVYYPAFLARGLVRQRTWAHFWMFIALAIGAYLAAQRSIVYVAWAVVFAAIVGFYNNSRQFMKHSTWRWADFFESTKPAAIIMAIMFAAMALVRYLALNFFDEKSPAMLLILSLAAVTSYFVTIRIFKYPQIKEVTDELFGKPFSRFRKKIGRKAIG